MTCPLPLRVLALVALASASISAQQPAPMSGAMMPKGQAMVRNEFKPFTMEAFDAAKAAGKTTLVFFHAPWCPMCQAQKPKVQAMLSGDFAHVVPFIVDYDSNMALRTMMKVEKQSTLILFKGATEVSRISYVVDDASIAKLFAPAKNMDMSR